LQTGFVEVKLQFDEQSNNFFSIVKKWLLRGKCEDLTITAKQGICFVIFI
jgi:hypothetical protein